MANSSYTPTNVLSSANVIAGAYGNSAQNLQIVVDATGRIRATPAVVNIANWPNMPSINGGQLGGFRNAVINGDMAIWQRGTVFTPTVAGTSTYCADRWHAIRAVNNYTVSRQSAGLTGFQFSIRQQRTASTSDVNAMSLSQSFLSVNSYRFQGKNVSISFWARCGANFSASGSGIAVSVSSGTGIDQNSNNGSGLTGVVNLISTSATLTTSWQRFTFSSGSAAGSSISQIACAFGFTPSGTAGANDWYEITGVQVEEGTTATAFEYVPFETQLRICQQYFEKSFQYGSPVQTAAGQYGFASPQIVGASSTCFYSVPFKVRKRTTTPTITLYNPTNATAQARNYVIAADFTATTLSTITDFGFAFSATAPAASALGNLISIAWAADSEIY